MSDPIHEAVKRAMSIEFGIEGIDDPDELRRVLDAKLKTMDAAQRTAFEMRLGQIAKEDAAGGPPGGKARVAVLVLMTVIGWFVWRPLAFISVIFALSSVRRFAIRHALFWSPAAALTVGTTYGVIMGVVVRLASTIAVDSMLGSILFAALGLLAAAYIGYGVAANPLLRMPGEEKRIIAQAGAVVSYSLTLLAWIGIRALVHSSRLAGS